MDPLSALSVAGTIIQFVDFGTRVLSSGMELYRSTKGSLNVSEELELVTGDLQAVLMKLRANAGPVASIPPVPQSSAEIDEHRDSFLEICNNATSIAGELLHKLNGLKVKDGKHCVWQTLRAAVKTAWSKDEISELKERLSNLTSSLTPRLLLEMGGNIDAAHLSLSSRFNALDRQTKRILEAIVSTNDSLSQEIVKSLASLICRSERTNEDAHHRTRQMIADLRKDIFSQFSTMDVITARVEMLNVGSEKEAQLRDVVNTTLLEQLSYSCMTNRYEEIREAHSETFKWIFCGAEHSAQPWDDFAKWLRQDDGIYWINGKAGSGKSTLMKHIFDSRHTAKYLQEWCHKRPSTVSECCIATFFFWNSGTDLQKSQQGLLRSLLFQVLSHNRDLIPIVLPTQWAGYYSERPALEQRFKTKVWSLRELHEAFERLIKQQEYQMSLCFFVDGLDEFSGDAEQLCMLFKRLEKASGMAKFCLSSRPWVAFQEQLGQCSKLRLQDLTFKDIEIYTRDKLQSSQAFMKLADRDPQLLESLKDEIMEKAQGVFLWVEVVIKLLLRGANKRDSNAQLWARLRSFPGELYPLYKTILMQIEPVYLEWASKTFQIMRRTMQLGLDPFRKIQTTTASTFPDFLESQPAPPIVSTLPLTVVFLLAALCDDAELDDIQEMSKENLELRCEETRIHLTARCAGLLEVSMEKSSATIFQGSTIIYMHRTARDFLEQESQWSMIVSYTDQSRFSPDLAMLRASVTMLMSKGFSQMNTYAGQLSSSIVLLGMPRHQKIFKKGFNLGHLRIAEDVVIYAHHADDHDGSINEQIKYLELYNTWRTRWIPQQSHITESVKDTKWLLGSTILGLSGFVKSILVSQDKAVQSETSGALLYALCSSEHFEPDVPFAKGKMVRVLLELSSDHVYSVPNALPRFKMGPRWPAALDSLGRIPKSDYRTMITPHLVESYVEVLGAFLAAGVDPTDIPSKVPPDYSLCRKSFEHDLFRETLLMKGIMRTGIFFDLAKLVFDRSVYAHNMKTITVVPGNHERGISKKRKMNNN
ncbi:hypothetical protein BKA64DRAFT_635725 [Cadophora sp. MPI-SDFR-AT-0126]|nr:hypothetical protein BKA64DRAFT_635725 [Leotiomycetes sp. MPI-SDFR-AT-0126]